MRLVHHVVTLCLVTLVVGSAPQQARSEGLTFRGASASLLSSAQISCNGGPVFEEKSKSSPGGLPTLSFNESNDASMTPTKAGCAGATTASAKAQAKHVASASSGRLKSVATLSSSITRTGDAEKDARLSGLGQANVDYEVCADSGGTYTLSATIAVSTDADTSSRGSVVLHAGSDTIQLNVGGTNPAKATIKKSGTLRSGDEVSLSAFALAFSEVGGLSSSSASWSIDLTVTGGSGEEPAPTGNVTGKVRYEKVPLTARGLQVAQRTPKPAAGVLVEAIDGDGAVLAATETDSLGRYGLDVVSEAPIRIRASAKMGNFEVRKLGADAELYSIATAPFATDTGGPVEKDLLATDDFDNGPFNLLFVARKCETLVHAADPGLVLPPLHFRWDPDTVTPTAFAPGQGSSTDEIFVSGRRSVDSDVFDDVVVAHEIGHYFVLHFSRNDSPGGRHTTTQKIDPRLSWGEGWATFFACAAMDSPLYRNSGPGGVLGRKQTYNIEQTRVARTPTDYTGEFTVASALWDIFDERADAGDRIALGFNPMWDALRSLTDDRYVYLGDFIDELYRADPSLGPKLRTILKKRRVKLKRGAAPDFAAPFPTPIAARRKVVQVADSILKGVPSGSAGLATSSRFFEFEITSPQRVDISLSWKPIGSAAHDLDLFLLDADGVSLFASEAHDGGLTESIVRDPLPAGKYVVQVSSFQEPSPQSLTFNRGRFTLSVDY